MMSHESSDRLAPNHTATASPLHDEIGDPSPIASNGTSSTDMEDSSEDGFENGAEERDDSESPQESPKHPDSSSGGSVKSDLTVRSPHVVLGPSYSEFPGELTSAKIKSIDTVIPRTRSDSDQTPLPVSVIHAPPGFTDFNRWEDGRSATPTRASPLSPAKFESADTPTTTTTANAGFATAQPHMTGTESPISPPPPPTPISTTVSPTSTPENATPRAQTRQEIEALELDKESRRRVSRNLEDIPEAQHMENEEMFDGDETLIKSKDEAIGNSYDSAEEIKVLNTALGECWTLCNTLAGLSSIHRERIFKVDSFSGARSVQEHAFKCCWRLCMKLYDNREEDTDTQVRPTLDLCRDFCQSLFEIRQRDNEIADSVLRVSFELNNHLYNTHDRNLPEAFRERTLDFYITLCHRLMKQRSGLIEETDTLLRACWSLAEMLFSLRQNRRENKEPDEELLCSAVQACWELCDLFREGWTQIRPDRGTPRASQTKFNTNAAPVSQSKLPTVPENKGEPETPTTIFDDVAISPDEAPAPNIIVLGTENSRLNPRWSSNSSTLSGYSQTSQTSSTATPHTIPEAIEDVNMTRLKVLIVKAAMNCGFQRSQGQTLNMFVKSLSSNSFGTTSWQMSLLENYKKMVLNDPALRAPAILPSRRASASEVGRAVIWMMRAGAYPFLRDLYRLVFGFHLEEADLRKNVMIQT
ncbi:hypothetical protein FGG08_002657 [Glutinoglossum americanum]|uniref:DUF7624 domain-containing protein n=1 Tax=Glutinoglossum americanum TaxID=1670608 RepID=A0A9P8L4A8_9PEZI|nr:hypothetical protein FGG08_002657 [Glutinoglossum americanum]